MGATSPSGPAETRSYVCPTVAAPGPVYDPPRVVLGAARRVDALGFSSCLSASLSTAPFRPQPPALADRLLNKLDRNSAKVTATLPCLQNDVALRIP